MMNKRKNGSEGRTVEWLDVTCECVRSKSFVACQSDLLAHFWHARYRSDSHSFTLIHFADQMIIIQSINCVKLMNFKLENYYLNIQLDDPHLPDSAPVL